MKKKTKSKSPNLPVPTAPAQKACAIPGDAEAASAIRQQYSAVVNAECVVFKERVRLGLMLLEWERFLGEARGGAGGGASGGLKGWLKANIPELSYMSAFSYKTMAERTIKMLGGGAVVTAALLGNDQAVKPDGEVIDVPSDVVENCEKFFEKVDSRRQLEQMWFKFALSDNKAKKKKAKDKTGLTGEGLSMAESATMMWFEAMKVFETNRAAFHSSARDLRVDVANKFLSELKMLVEALESRLETK